MPSPASAPRSDDAPPELPGSRERLIAAMGDALRRRGLHGIGLTELLQQAGAPKGVLYHHFPGGKTELAIAAIDAAAGRVLDGLDALIAEPSRDLGEALAGWLRAGLGRLTHSGYEAGCPLATVALESTADDAALRDALARAFGAIRQRLQAALQARGLPEARAQALAGLLLAAYEGALMQARVAADAAPMHASTELLADWLRRELAVQPAPPARPTSPPLPTAGSDT
jgi:TetR/AcrR family transcriptional repressor of lmrAB and yxaGH operons